MTTPDLISALKSATPEESTELAGLIALMLTHAAPAAVESMRATLQIGDRYTITRQAVVPVVGPGGMDAPRKTGGAMG